MIFLYFCIHLAIYVLNNLFLSIEKSTYGKIIDNDLLNINKNINDIITTFISSEVDE